VIVDTVTIRECATDAVRYWEPRRIIYNLVLAAIVLAYFGGRRASHIPL